MPDSLTSPCKYGRSLRTGHSHLDPVLYADIFMQMIEIEFQAHEPKKITIKKKAGESFGMKLGTRVFVQGLTKDGLADKEGVSTKIHVFITA